MRIVRSTVKTETPLEPKVEAKEEEISQLKSESPKLEPENSLLRIEELFRNEYIQSYDNIWYQSVNFNTLGFSISK